MYHIGPIIRIGVLLMAMDVVRSGQSATRDIDPHRTSRYVMLNSVNSQLVEIDEDPCPIGHFGCNATLECVEQRKNCDGTADCADGSDEWNCADLIDSTFWDHLFRKRPAARFDDLDMEECVWLDLNNTCGCRSDELHCQHRELSELPSDLPDDGISLLDLTGNSFPVLAKEFFDGLPEVEVIVMKHCSIREITSHTFERLGRIAMHTLYLDQNKVERLPEYLFPPNNRLNVLVLAGNQITQIHDDAFANLDRLEELDLRDNRIVLVNVAIFRPLVSLRTLYLNGNAITFVHARMLPRLPTLRTLSLSDNQIMHIEAGALMLPHLEHLFLSGNRLRSIRNDTFINLPTLLGLNLNDNRIIGFEAGAFNGIDNLTSLLLEGNAFQQIDVSVMAQLTRLQYVYFSSFHLCKAAVHVRVCEPRGDGISSTEHLLENTVLRASVWLMATVGIFGNLLVLCGSSCPGSRSKRGQSGRQVEHSLYLRHLAASDLIMGIYLAIIAVVDCMYRGDYLQFDESWRHGVLCSFCGFLSTLSCQSSTLLLTLITWDRLVSVTRPLQPRPSNRTRAILRLTLLWVASGVAAGSPLTAIRYFGEHFYGTNGVCLSLHIHDPYAQGWEYSASMFIVVNSLSLIFITISYFRMLQAIRGSGEAMRSTVSGRENTVARRFAVIVTTDCMCWLPVITVKIAALAGARISPDLYAWLAVLVLPVNSALNPVLYTLTTAAFKQKLSKLFEKLPCGWICSLRATHNHAGYESAAVSFSTNPATPLAATSSSIRHSLQRRTTQSTITSSYRLAAPSRPKKPKNKTVNSINSTIASSSSSTSTTMTATTSFV